MGQNVRDVIAHLGCVADETLSPDPVKIWTALLGPLAAPLLELCNDIDEQGLGSCPAVVFADQSKAFERIGIEWLLRVLTG